MRSTVLPASTSSDFTVLGRWQRLAARKMFASSWRIRRLLQQHIGVRKVRFVTIVVAFALLYLLYRYMTGATRTSLPTTLCVAVLSTATAEGSTRRDACRNSWLSLVSPGDRDMMKAFFFLGKPVQDKPASQQHTEREQLSATNRLVVNKDEQSQTESVVDGLSRNDPIRLSLEQERRQHGDIVELHMDDVYANLTLKLIQAIQYLAANENCQFILKADDDTFARVDLILAELASMTLDRWLYWGYFTGRAAVYHKGRWAESDWFLCDRYLPYARGGGYVFSGGLAAFIAGHAHLWQRYFSEDVSFGVWTAGLLLKRVHDPRFDTEYSSRGCLNSYLVTHKQTSDEMLRKIDRLRKTGRLCASEAETRPAYRYNWQLPPTQCCDQPNDPTASQLRRPRRRSRQQQQQQQQEQERKQQPQQQEQQRPLQQ